MARPITHRVALPLPKREIDRAKRIAREWGVTLHDFLRQCIEGRMNQIEASQKR